MAMAFLCDILYSQMTLMLRAWYPSVFPSVCNIGGLWSHSATESGNCTCQDRSLSWLFACWSRPGL